MQVGIVLTRLRRHGAVLLTVFALAVLATLVGPPTRADATGSSSASGRGGATVVAMGDSYASGEGTFDYRPETDTATNRCHRSDQAYGAVLARFAGGRLVACSGAATRDIVNANAANDERAQVDALSRRTRLVTLGIGGNDLGFSELLLACVAATRVPTQQCSTNPLVQASVDVRLAALAGRTSSPSIVSIDALVTAIRLRAPDAQIVLVGYPHLLGARPATYAEDATVPSGRSCALDATGAVVLDYADARWVNRTTDRLNRVFETVAERRRGVSFAAADTFRGHALCDRQTSWINPVVFTGPATIASESVHPTSRGQRAYLQAVLAELAELAELAGLGRELRRSVSAS